MNNFNAEYAAVLSTRIEREMISLPKDEYLQKAKGLSELASNKLALRFGRKYFDELTTAGIQEVEVLALLLEMEDEQLKEWRQAIGKIRARNTKDISG
jgi:hypothetical protein